MNAFQSCPNTTDAVPLYLPQQLYLKPIARICINVQLPTQKMIGKSVSNWELMDQLRTLIRPDEFPHLKVIKTTAETIRFEAEVEHKNKLFRVLSKIDRKMVKLKDISDVLKIKAAETKLDFPTKQTWDDFFANSKDMNEMKPGERPDTVHLSNLPTKWFVPYHMAQEDDNAKPSEKVFYRIFEKFGHIRAIDIPICDPYRHRMKAHIAGLQTTTFDEAAEFFEGYVQFRDYIGFTKCMDAFRNMKLLRKENRHHGSVDEEAISINMSVDFDRTKHLSEASIKRREIVRDRLVTKEQDREDQRRVDEQVEDAKKIALRQKELDLKSEKQKRRMQREERRKAKILSQLKIQKSDEINDKIAKEEKKLLQVQRKLEAIRIVEELFKRITTKNESAKSSALKNRRDDEDELTKLKRSSELEVHEQREKLNKAVKGGVVLKSILGTPRHRSRSSSSNSSVERNMNKEIASTSKVSAPPTDNNHIQVHPSDMMFPANSTPHWHPYEGGRGVHNGMYYGQHMIPMGGPPGLPAPRPDDEFYNPHAMQKLSRGGMMWHGGGQRGGSGQYQRRPRGVYNRGRGQMGRGFNRNLPAHMNNCYYPPDVQDEYFRYFQKFLSFPNSNQQHDRRGSRSQSRSRSRSRSRSYSRRSSRSKSRSRRRRSYSRSRSRSHRRSRSRSRTRSKDRGRSTSKSKSRDRSRDRRSRSGDKTKKETRGRYSRERRSRSKSRTPRSRSPPPRRNSKSPRNGNSTARHTPVSERDEGSKRKLRSHSASSAKSVDSSAFVPPNRRRSTRSKSWSMPTDDAATEPENALGKSRRRTWSKSPQKQAG